MPYKDAAPYLEQAARSVLSQTWPAVELVLVDDGGTDGSDSVAERVLASEPERVRLVSHPGRVNRGIGASRRLGFQHAAGELLANLDADDVWEPAHLADQLRLLAQSPGADVVQGRAWYWWSWAGDGSADLLFPPAFAPGVVVPGQKALGAILRNGGYAAPPCSVLFRASLLGEWTEVLDAFPGMYEDQVLHSGLQLRGNLVISGATTAWYRQHSKSISAQQLLPDAASRFDRGRHEFLSWLTQQSLLEDPGVREQLDRNIRELHERPPATSPAARRSRRRPLPAPARKTMRRARSAAAQVVTGVEQALSRHGGTHVGLAAQHARPERLRLMFQRDGADLRGRVLVLGREHDALPDGLAAVAELRPLAPLGGAPGPLHPLASLPTAGYDCIVALQAEGDGTWSRHDVRHLRRCLDRGGVLLLAAHRPHGDVVTLSREVFGADLVHAYWQVQPGPVRHPLLTLRAVVPA